MDITIRQFQEADLPAMIKIWNEVIDCGVAFPESEPLTLESGSVFFNQQSYVGLAVLEGEIKGLYLLYPSASGRCSHICGVKLAVSSEVRGQNIGEGLVRDSIHKAHNLGYRILTFDKVVRTNYGAIRLYEKMGFELGGTIRGGFLTKDGYYEDILTYYQNI